MSKTTDALLRITYCHFGDICGRYLLAAIPKGNAVIRLPLTFKGRKGTSFESRALTLFISCPSYVLPASIYQTKSETISRKISVQTPALVSLTIL